MRTKKNILYSTFIGLEIEITNSSQRELVGLKGKVVDETKNLIIVEKSDGKEVKIPENLNLQTTGQDTGEYIYYLVKPGETLWDIAKKFPGVTDSELMQLNGISDAGKIQPGQIIKVQKKG